MSYNRVEAQAFFHTRGPRKDFPREAALAPCAQDADNGMWDLSSVAHKPLRLDMERGANTRRSRARGRPTLSHRPDDKGTELTACRFASGGAGLPCQVTCPCSRACFSGVKARDIRETIP